MAEQVLLTGATGFVGTRLRWPLRRAGFHVRCLSRRPDAARRAHPLWDWREGDLGGDEAPLRAALEGVSAAFYLVHSLGTDRPTWEHEEQENAARFAELAAQAGVGRIVYLGGVAPSGPASPHLAARLNTGVLLRRGRVPCVELRAGMIVGKGSASWQMVRDLAARLPLFAFPAWLSHRSEPVGIDDVVAALVWAARADGLESDWTDLPGPEPLSGEEVLRRTAALLGRRPRTVVVPDLDPARAAEWLPLFTGVNPRLAAQLVAGLTSDLLAQRRDFWRRAGLAPRPFDAAARQALDEAP